MKRYEYNRNIQVVYVYVYEVYVQSPGDIAQSTSRLIENPEVVSSSPSAAI